MRNQIHNVYENKSQQGFSYVEVIVATLLIAVTLVPALNAIQAGLAGSEVYQSLSNQHYQIVSKIEEVLAQPYSAIEAAATTAGNASTPTVYSDISGVSDRRLVYLFGYDGDNADADDDFFTGVDDGLMWVRVEIENSARNFETVISR